MIYKIEKNNKLNDGDWGLGIGPNPQSPITFLPHSPSPNKFKKN